MRVPPHHYKELCELFAAVRSRREADLLLQDILTPQEIESLAERWQLIQMLGKRIPQRAIAKRLKISICKITRGSRVMQYGAGGFKLFLRKLKGMRESS